MTIQVDVDGVLNNLMDVTIEIYNERYGSSYTVNDITTYNLSNCFEASEANQMKKIFIEPEIWDKVKPVEGAQAGLQKLINSGNQVYLVTNNSPHTYGKKFDWIRNYFPFVEPSKIVCMSDKWMFKADIMIEDCWDTLIARTFYDRILMDQPWNQSSKDYVYGIKRCYNWDDIVAAVDKIRDGE